MATISDEGFKYKRLFETTHIGILILDCKTHEVADANPFITKLAGYPKNKLVGKKISQLNLFKDNITGKRIFADLAHQEEAFYDNVELISKNGDKKIVEISAHIYKINGNPMVQCIIRDLTEKRTAQRELFETNQRLEALMNALPVGVSFSLDPECKHIVGNPYMARKLEMHAEENLSVSAADPEALGRRLRHLHDGKEIKPKNMPIQQAIAKNSEVGPFEIQIELPSGKTWIVEASAAPVRDTEGKVIGAVAVNVDLTERKRAEETDKLSRIVEQEKLKMAFIADAAHELRTPLAIIRGNADLALHNKIKSPDALAAINVEVTHLTNLISDLSLLTTKETEVARKVLNQKIDLKELVMRVAKRHESFAHKKSIVIHTGNIPQASITGDAHYLERLFSNILSNAVSYGKENGEVWIDGEKDSKFVRILMKDNGVGIAEKDLPLIFERFFRAEASRSKDYGGSGLGLAIVKWIAEAHGGSVSASSTEGKGSLFTVSLPISKSK